MRATPIRECLWLVSHGIPFDVAFALDDVTREAWSIIVSEQASGMEYDHAAQRFKERK